MIMTRDSWKALAEEYSAQHIHTCSCRGIGFVRVSAPVGHSLFGKALPCVCRRDMRARERAQALRRESGISDVELSTWTFEMFNSASCRPAEVVEEMTRIKQSCEHYAEKPQGWLLMTGVPGSGKTHLAYAIAATSLRVDRPVYAHPVPDMLDVLRSGYDSGGYDVLLERIKGVELLVLDDLGAQRGTEWEREVLYQIINHRYAKRLGMVVTMNRPVEDLDERLASRLSEGSEAAGGWSRWLRLPCSDYRPHKGWKRRT